MQTIGDRIKKKRKELNLTQLELANKLNVTDRAVSKWEQNDGNPDFSLLTSLAEILNVSLDYLITGKEKEINLDDRDAFKRMEYLIKKDDVDNFVKFNYIKKTNQKHDNAVFGSDIRFGNSNLTCLNNAVWVKLFENDASKIINKCFDMFVELNTTEVSAAVLVVDFMNDFVKYAVKLDRDDVLKCIGARYFSVGDVYKTRYGKKEIPPLRGHRQTHNVPLYIETYDNFMSSFVGFGISKELFIEILSSREKAPKCYKYLTSPEFYISSNRFGRKIIAYTSYDSDMIDALIEIGSFDKVREFAKVYGELLNSLELDKNFESITGSFAVRQNFVHGRVMTFTMSQIETCIKKGEVELVNIMIAHNKNVISKYISASSSYGRIVQNIAVLSESEVNRKIALGRDDLSDNDRLSLECVNNHIIVPSKLRKSNDLKFIRKVLDNNAYHYYEFVFNCLTKDNIKLLFEFFVDNDLTDMAAKLMVGSSAYKEILSSCFHLFIKDPNNKDNRGYNYDKFVNLIKVQNLIGFEALTQEERQHIRVYHSDEYGRQTSKMEYCQKYTFQNEFKRKYGEFSTYAGCLEDNPIITHIKELKESIYESVVNRLAAEKKAQEEAVEREKIAKGLTKDYFENLLATGGTELFYIKLCSLLDAIFKFDYHYEGEEFSARMNAHFAKLEALAPKSRDCDDGWGYMVLDTEYEKSIVKPEAQKIAHLRDIINRLRIQRNNIAHSEKNAVVELNTKELKECLDYVFSINKGE